MNCPSATDWMLYLAGTLEPQAHQRLDDHAQTHCPACQAAMRQAQSMLDQIPLAIEPVQPPATARERLMAQVAQTPQTPPSLERAQATPRTPQATGTRRPILRVLQWVSGCAAAAALAAGVTFMTMDQQVKRQQVVVDQLRQQVAQFDTQATQHNQQIQHLMDIGSELFTTLRSSAVQMIQFHGAEESTQAAASMLWDRERNVIHFFGPSELQAGGDRQFKLWIATEDEQIVPVVTFKPDRFGQARLEVQVLEDYANMLDWLRISYDDADTPEEYLLAGDFPG